MPPDARDYVSVNAAAWNARHDDQVRTANRGWSATEASWGIFQVPEREVQLFPERLDGADAVELGCGTAYVSAWMARRGARPIGVDPAAGQLEIARSCQEEFELEFPLVRATGEEVPLASGSFDFVISEYGAAIWADPYAWIPEAARLLRPGGELVFLCNSLLLMLCAPDDETAAASNLLVRDQFRLHRIEWSDDHTVEFHLGHGDVVRLLRSSGFEVLDLIELWPPPGASTRYTHVTNDWASRWPCEEVWRARRR